MSNKSTGTKFEREFAELLAKHWFWVHLFQDNKNGQPCDVVAARNGKIYLIDCKDCAVNYFLLSRMEENQYNAMKLFDLTGNGKGMLAIRFPSEQIYLIKYDKIEELSKAGFGRINETVCKTQGVRFREWLKTFADEEQGNDSHDWK